MADPSTQTTPITGSGDPPPSASAAATSVTDPATAAQTSATASTPPPAAKFDIPEMIQKTYPDLVELILQTESMNDEERQYWFHMIPIMTGEQVKKLRTILVNERDQLKKLDKEYESELIQMNEKHTNAWKAEEVREKRETMKKAESQSEQEEKQAEEILLKKLNQV